MAQIDTNREQDCTELLQALIRNACVNDGTEGSGNESRSADLLATYLEGPGLDLERFEGAPGRASLAAPGVKCLLSCLACVPCFIRISIHPPARRLAPASALICV